MLIGDVGMGKSWSWRYKERAGEPSADRGHLKLRGQMSQLGSECQMKIEEIQQISSRELQPLKLDIGKATKGD